MNEITIKKIEFYEGEIMFLKEIIGGTEERAYQSLDEIKSDFPQWEEEDYMYDLQDYTTVEEYISFLKEQIKWCEHEITVWKKLGARNSS